MRVILSIREEILHEEMPLAPLFVKIRREGDLNSRGADTSGFRGHRLSGLDYLGMRNVRITIAPPGV